MMVKIRRIEPGDERRWRELWDEYTRFYNRTPREAVTSHTWTRIMDETCPVHAIVAECAVAGVIGIANYVIHQSTSSIEPACYLADLFVDSFRRAEGVGRSLIDWLIAEMKAQGWSRLYWHTKEDNYRARSLYDKYTRHSEFLRYVLTNPQRDYGPS